MLKDAILKVKIFDGTELDERLTRSTVKLENDLTITVPNSLIHFEEKADIPKVVGDWIFKAQLLDRCSLRSALDTDTIRLYAKNGDEVIDWLKDTSNQDIFASAWANGYTVEKEPIYKVKLKNIAGDEDYLVKTSTNGLRFYNNIYTKSRTHTREELKRAGFDWVFDCPGIEVEEVTE